MINPRVFVLGLLSFALFAVLVPIGSDAQGLKDPVEDGFGRHSHECSIATIVGAWGFKTDGFYLPSGALDGYAVGIFKIQPNGTMRGKYDTEGPGGFIPGLVIEGSVVVNSDCTGTLTLQVVGANVTVTQSLVIAQNGKKILGMMQDPTIDIGTFTAIRLDEDD